MDDAKLSEKGGWGWGERDMHMMIIIEPDADRCGGNRTSKLTGDSGGERQRRGYHSRSATKYN